MKNDKTSLPTALQQMGAPCRGEGAAGSVAHVLKVFTFFFYGLNWCHLVYSFIGKMSGTGVVCERRGGAGAVGTFWFAIWKRALWHTRQSPACHGFQRKKEKEVPDQTMVQEINYHFSFMQQGHAHLATAIVNCKVCQANTWKSCHHVGVGSKSRTKKGGCKTYGDMRDVKASWLALTARGPMYPVKRAIAPTLRIAPNNSWSDDKTRWKIGPRLGPLLQASGRY